MGDGVVVYNVVLALVQADNIERSVHPVSEKHDDLIAGFELRHSGNPEHLRADPAAELAEHDGATAVALDWIVDGKRDVRVDVPAFIPGLDRRDVCLKNVVR